MYFGQNRKSRARNVVGITSRASESSFQWLAEVLNSRFSDLLEVNYLPITNTNRCDWEEAVKTCSAVILYHTKHEGRLNITDMEGALYNDELNYLNKVMGREKIAVLLDDMNDAGEEERRRILKTQPSLQRLSSLVILIPENNKFEVAFAKIRQFSSAISEGTSLWGQEKSSQMHGTSSSLSASALIHSHDTKHGKPHTTKSTSSKSNAPSKPKPSLDATYQIGIFSRSAESNYSWLMDNLKSDDLIRSAKVKAICITNKYEMFTSELRNCHFAILYHSKNQGRLNITNVADSLYDNELRDMSESLGRRNVIVVADDLASGGPEEKERIMKHQPRIGEFAQNLFLFKEKQKDTKNLETIRQIIKRSLSDFQASHSVYLTTSSSLFKPLKSLFASFVDGPTNKMVEVSVSSGDSSPSSSGSVGYDVTSQKNDPNVTHSKRPKTFSSIENSNPADVRDVSNLQDQHIVHHAASLGDGESGIRELESSSNSPKNKVTQVQVSSPDPSSSHAGSPQYHTASHKSSFDESQSNTRQTSSSDMDTASTGERKFQDMEERETILQDREERVIERDRDLEERETILQDREERVIERDNLEERERKLQEVEKRLKILQDREEEIIEKVKELEEREKTFQNREERVIERVRDLEETERKLQDREKRVIERDRDLEERERKLQEVEKRLKILQDREERVIEREIKLEETERKLQDMVKRQKTLWEREERVIERDRDLEERERKWQEVEKRQKTLQDREVEIREKEKELEERERTILERESNGDGHEKAKGEREKTQQQPETKGKEIKLNPLLQEREDTASGHDTPPEGRERFLEKDGHFIENLPITEGSSCLEIQTLRQQIRDLQEMIKEKDRIIQRKDEEIANYEYITNPNSIINKK